MREGAFLLEKSNKTRTSLAEYIGYLAGYSIFGWSFYAAWVWGSRGSWKFFLELIPGAVLGLAAYWFVRAIGAGLTRIIRKLRKGGLLAEVLGIFIWFSIVIGSIGIGFGIGPRVYEKIQDTLGINQTTLTIPSSAVMADATCEGEDPSLKIWPSVVKITAKTPQGPVQGSGFVVDSSKGYILTASHVVAQAYPNSIEIEFRGKSPRRATMVASYSTADIALIHTDTVASPQLRFAPPASGSTVFAVGYVGDSYTHIPNRVIDRVLDNAGWTSLVTDARARGGMSGGPLVNRCGELVGIITNAVFSPRATGRTVVVVINLPIVAKMIAFANKSLTSTPPPPKPTATQLPTHTPIPTSTQLRTQTPMSLPTATRPKDGQTYISLKRGYSISILPGWIIDASNEAEVKITSTNGEAILVINSDPLPGGDTVDSIVEWWVASIIESWPTIEIYQESVTLGAGEPGLLFWVEVPWPNKKGYDQQRRLALMLVDKGSRKYLIAHSGWVDDLILQDLVSMVYGFKLTPG